ncbi:MAG TPA: FUSC family protein [Caulobacteraceae bacterium]|jgi:multidrug resistance protein MdtO
MAPPVAASLNHWGRSLLRLLGPAPGRLEFATRLALICALTTLATELYRTPDPALTVYVVFFLNKPDRATSLVTNLILLILITLIIGLVMLVGMAVTDLPMWRVVAIATLSFAFLFLTSASKLRPIGSIIALIVGYGLDELGLVPGGEIATRGLLYAWLFVATPVCISIAVNLLLAPPPRRMAERALAHRLAQCAAMLRAPDRREREDFDEFLREGAGEIPAWLKLAGVEKTARTDDLAALRQATASTMAVELLVDLALTDLAVGEPQAALPPSACEAIAAVLDEMAEILRRGGYPLEIALPPLDGENALPELSRTLLADMRQALAGFAEPTPSEPAAAPAAKSGGGFLLPDAFTNPEHVQFALKTTAAAMFCYALYTQLDWPKIHTCFITCYIVGLTTTAETVQKLTLRVIGCLIGATAGIAAIVYVVPHLASIGALMALVFAGALASAWVAAGDPKIAYSGFQIAFAFFLCVLQGSGPAFDMVTARDRVIGILIGNLVCYLMFALVWPVSLARRIDPAVRELIRGLGVMVLASNAQTRRALAASSLVGVGALERDLDFLTYEPKKIRPSADWLKSRRKTAQDIAALTGPLLLSADHFPKQTASYATRLEGLAEAFSSQSPRRLGLPSPVQSGPAALTALIEARLESLERSPLQDAEVQEAIDHALA